MALRIAALAAHLRAWLTGAVGVEGVDDADGQGLVEYALILVLVALVVIAVLAILGPAIGNAYSGIVSSL